jgi:prophage antirepressor-like protein
VSSFNFRGFDLRCVMIDDQPWFAAADVCAVLNIRNTSKATAKLTSSELSRKKLSTATHARPNNM